MLWTWDSRHLTPTTDSGLMQRAAADGDEPGWVPPQPVPATVNGAPTPTGADALAALGVVPAPSAPPYDPVTQWPPVWSPTDSGWLVVGRDPAAVLADAVAARVAEIQVERDTLLAGGAPYAGKRIAVDDSARADLAGMTLAALLAQADPSAWAAGYALGWITADNSRVPLPTPANGLALAAAVGSWYATVIQAARSAKDEALALAVDPADPWAWREALGASQPAWPEG